MPANFNSDITVNVYGNAQPVTRSTFGRIGLVSMDVTFSEDYKIIESANDAATDAELGTVTKAALAIFFSQSPRPTDIMVIKVSAYTAYTAELAAHLAALPTGVDYFGLCTLDRTDVNTTDIIAFAEANEKLCLVLSEDSNIGDATTPNLFDDESTLARKWAGGIWHGAAEYADLALLAAGLSASPDFEAAVWYDRTLSGVTPHPDITTTQKTNVEAVNGNLYLTLLDVGATGPGKTFDGNWIDERVTKAWFKARIREGIAQLKLNLANSNKKIPYTNVGLAMIAAEVRGVFQKGVAAGHFVEGSLVLTVPDIADVDSADIIARQCTISATATLTGGIKDATVNVGVLNS